MGLIASALIILSRGGKGLKSIINISKCDAVDWIVMAGYVVILSGLALLGIIVINKEQTLKQKSGWNFDQYDKKIEKSFLIKGNIIGLFTGIISSITGLGGGTILNPVLQSFEILPVVSTFCSMYLTFFNKIVSTFVDIIGN